jgi:ABC-type transport system involved in multi-copper enzyme maturation permease subunit
MNPIVRKEIRLLLPSFVTAMAAALLILLLPRQTRADSFWNALPFMGLFLFCPGVAVMLSLDSFGREVSARTFSVLIAQPVSRIRVWKMKTLLLAGALILIWLIWLTSLRIVTLGGNPAVPSDLRTTIHLSLLFLITVFSGGLWTVLLFRQVAIAFWFTLLTPAALCTAMPLIFGPSVGSLKAFAATLVVYSGIGFFFARWLFMRAQDIQWSGGEIALPALRSLKNIRIGDKTRRRFRPRLAMIMREFQLHQSQLLIAAGLAVIHLAMIGIRNLGSSLNRGGEIDFVAHHFWSLWFVMPLLIGCGAVAEERKLGTLEGELCLPARRRTQFAIKLGVALLLSILFGTVMPLLLEKMDGTSILPHRLELWNGYARDLIAQLLPIMPFVALSIASAAIAFYFSSLSRNTLQALGPTILGAFASAFLFVGAAHPEDLVGYPLWRGFLPYVIGIPTLIGVGLWLMYGNYRRIQIARLAWTGNLLAIAATLLTVVGVSTALYHRAWELLMPLEPTHGAARLSVSRPALMKTELGSVAVQLSDGRIWSGNIGFTVPSFSALLKSDWRMTELSGGSRFLEGTNWSSVAECIYDTVAIQNDGSLWVSEKPLPREFFRMFNRTNEMTHESPKPFERIGEDHDWKTVVSFSDRVLLLKRDGTLWTWRTEDRDHNEKWPGLRAFPLEQIGTEWAAISKLGGFLVLRKTDGRTWSNCILPSEPGEDFFLTAGWLVKRAAFLDGHDWRGIAWPQSLNDTSASGLVVGVRDDGTLRLLARCESRLIIGNGMHGVNFGSPVSLDQQISQETNWLDAVAFGDDIITLKSDGSLWRWHFGGNQDDPDRATAEHISTHSDWIVIAGNNFGFNSLAADGSLWFWRAGFGNSSTYQAAAHEFGFSPLIGVSRKPQKIGNIFAASNF